MGILIAVAAALFMMTIMLGLACVIGSVASSIVELLHAPTIRELEEQEGIRKLLQETEELLVESKRLSNSGD